MIAEGTKVRFTEGPLGVMAGRVEDRALMYDPRLVVYKGETGRYDKQHGELDYWHLISVEIDGKPYTVPCGRTMFEVVTDD